MIPDSFIQKVKDMNDISDVIGQFVHLEKKGKNAWACCPFHGEKTPSFAVNLQTQTYKCFGCGERGNVISFLMNYKKFSYVESIEYLADRVHLEVPREYSPEEFEKKKVREKLFACLKTTARYYFDSMNSESGTNYLKYWYSRGLDADTIRHFGLGASTDWSSTIKHLVSKGFDLKTIAAAGISEEKNGQVMDAEHHRCIVPIFNEKGAVVAFGGRILEDKGFAKYKNTQNTDVFFKSYVVYNLNRFREQNTRTVILVEGYMDVIALFQAGFENAVAPMGTSFTDEQCTAIRRYADTIYVSFDGDSAGRKATLTAIEKLKKQNFEIRIVTEPDELDPDEVIKKYGREGFQKCLDEALPWIDYKLKVIEKGFDLKSLDGRAKYSKVASEFLQELDVVTREIYYDKVAEKASIPREALSQELRGKPRKIENAPNAVQTIQVKEEPKREDGITRAETNAARFILGMFVNDKVVDDFENFQEVYFWDDKHKEVCRYLEKCKQNFKKPSENDLFDLLTGDKEVNSILEEYEKIPAMKQLEHMEKCAEILKKEFTKRRKNELLKRIGQATSEEDKNRLLEELQSL